MATGQAVVTATGAPASDDGPSAAQWSARYDAGDTPWDLGRPHPELERRLAEDPGLGGPVGTAVVPGCGRGHDALALARAGWDVVAVDVAPSAVDLAREALAPLGGRVVHADALAVGPDDLGLDRPADLVLDHTLFCAVPLGRRAEIGGLCDRVLGPGGRLVSIVFPIGRDHGDGGPPWGMAPDHVDAALGAGWVRVATGDPVEVPGRAWPHRVCTWTRA